MADSSTSMVTQLAENLSNQLSAKSFDIPALPAVAIQALTLAQDERTDTQQLAHLITKDQALAGHVLRMVNSAAYGGARTVASLRQAITMLGMQTVAEMTLTICVKGSVFSKREFLNLSQLLWRHALATALFSKEIARQQRKNVETAYLCGLLHRIGMPIVLSAINNLTDSKKPENEQDVCALLDEFHIGVGLQASETWQLPSEVLTAIINSPHYERAKTHRHIAAIVHLSNKLATVVIEEGDMETIADLPVLEELSIYPNQLAEIVAQRTRIEAAIA